MKRLRGLAVALALLLPAGPAAADALRAGDIVVERPWARATPPAARNGAAYLVLRNTGTEADRLVAATTDASARVELHAHIRDGDIVRMREMGAVDLPPGATVTLEPGGMHVMLVGLAAPLVAGERFRLALELERAGTLEVEVAVEAAGHQPQGRGHQGHGRHRH